MEGNFLPAVVVVDDDDAVVAAMPDARVPAVLAATTELPVAVVPEVADVAATPVAMPVAVRAATIEPPVAVDETPPPAAADVAATPVATPVAVLAAAMVLPAAVTPPVTVSGETAPLLTSPLTDSATFELVELTTASVKLDVVAEVARVSATTPEVAAELDAAVEDTTSAIAPDEEDAVVATSVTKLACDDALSAVDAPPTTSALSPAITERPPTAAAPAARPPLFDESSSSEERWSCRLFFAALALSSLLTCLANHGLRDFACLALAASSFFFLLLPNRNTCVDSFFLLMSRSPGNFLNEIGAPDLEICDVY